MQSLTNPNSRHALANYTVIRENQLLKQCIENEFAVFSVSSK